MLEKHFENVLHRYPELIEEGLKFDGRQVSVGGKYVDLLFKDRFGQKLIVELKKGTIKREHVAQLLDYEGYFVSTDNPNVRVMLIGNRVPPNLRNSLDHHGFEWKEIPIPELIAYLVNKNDVELLGQFKEKDKQEEIVAVDKNNISNKTETQGSISILSDIMKRKYTYLIRERTNTVYRQNNQQLNGAGVDYTLSRHSWTDGIVTKKAIIYFSRASKNIVVIPAVIVDKHIFNPFFQKTSSGYCLRDKFKTFDIDHKNGMGRIDLIFIIEQDELQVSLKPPGRSQKLIPLISLPKRYWLEVDLRERDPVTCLIDTINIRCNELSAGEGVLTI
ncbi:MAG: DUF91 domain-containing protein [Desulfuromonadales bacterium]|nr:DUF91 domain-containing protein [Desulfuromonadales bacterium]